MKTAIYVRVSSPLPKVGETDQKIIEELKVKARQDTENQLLPINQYILHNKWDIVEIYKDHISSIKVRPNFNKMMEDARLGKFELLVVWKIDRFARSINDFCYWTQQLTKWGVRFIALQDNIDTDIKTAAGQLLMNMLACFAQFERQIIVERIHASLAMRRAKGLPIGRTKIVDKIGKIYELHKAGMSVRKIAKEVGESKSLVMRRLNEYYGKNPEALHANAHEQADIYQEVIIETFQENNRTS